MITTKFSPWPSYTPEETEAVAQVLISNKVNYWTGNECREFEKEFATWSDSKYAIAVANGTVALDLAFLALNIGAGDEVIVTSRTFLASVSSIVLAGATPVFADVCHDSQNITANTIEAVRTSKTKAIVCVHLAGWPCDMDPIMDLAEQHHLYVIEDCAQAHGARYKGRSVGSIGHISAWSFCQDKIMTTGGEGGIVTTNDKTLWSKMWAYKDHGKSWEAVYEREHPPGFRWLHDSFGTNWRMTEIQAAIGRIQLRRMPEWHDQRVANATRIWETAARFSAVRVPTPYPLPGGGASLKGCEISSRTLSIPIRELEGESPIGDEPSKKMTPPPGRGQGEGLSHAAYKCYIFVRPEALKPDWSRDRIMAEINAHGVPCFSGSCSEVYLEKAFDNTPFRPKERLPVAKELGETSLMFLVHPTLSQDNITQTCDAIEKVMMDAQI
jgi:dTDP-4-amino-4,6-dideoxygalactose transaminase